MRVLVAAATIAACVAVSWAVDAKPNSSPGIALPPAIFRTHLMKQDLPTKPGADENSSDSCRWARDNECDEPDIGTGGCPLGTDYSDCRALRAGEDDSCRWANDNECDEPRFGTGACAQGADRTDCGDVAWLRNQTDSCATAFNGICEDPTRGSGSCMPRTDRSDCRGRTRPALITDHFFGHDDRVFVPANEAPWRYVGLLRMDTGVGCTATLIARDVILTAANCLYTDGRFAPQGSFVSSTGDLSARFTAYLMSRRYNDRLLRTSNRVDGHDWALLRLDEPLGDELGYASIRDLIGESQNLALTTDLMQAGYAWDTGANLAGHLACRMDVAYRDNTFSHQCDTTRGDAGSAFFVPSATGFDIVGVDSNFRNNPGSAPSNIAVGAASFQRHVAAFVAGRTGRPIR